MTRPVLLYDGDCGFCQASARLARRFGNRAAVVAYQDADLAPLGLAAEECAAAVRYVDARGRRSGGHRAVAAFLRDCPPPWRLLRLPLLVPGTDRLWARVYDLVARNRTRLPGGSPRCDVPADPPRDRSA